MAEEQSNELPRKYRPTKLGDLRGQPDIVKQVIQWGKAGKIPQFLLLEGPSGCGKTTLARILRLKLQCSDIDFVEINAADFRGIDTVRAIRDRVGMAPMGGKSRVWLVDESHKLSSDAMSAFLKILEEPRPGVYFILCTTDPQKLLPTIKTRATRLTFKLVKDDEMTALVESVVTAEGAKVGQEVVEKLVKAAEGSPRKALVLLNQVIGLANPEDQLAAVSIGEGSAQVIDLCRALINPGMKWPAVAKILKAIEDDPESVRRAVLGYARSVLLGCGNLTGRAAAVISNFERPVYDSGAAGLAYNAYLTVMTGGK